MQCPPVRSRLHRVSRPSDGRSRASAQGRFAGLIAIRSAVVGRAPEILVSAAGGTSATFRVIFRPEGRSTPAIT
jgi:hypothetical protein